MIFHNEYGSFYIFILSVTFTEYHYNTVYSLGEF